MISGTGVTSQGVAAQTTFPALPPSLVFSHLNFKEKYRRFSVVESFLLSGGLAWPFQTTEPQ